VPGDEEDKEESKAEERARAARHCCVRHEVSG
jgi:hypothetical protein